MDCKFHLEENVDQVLRKSTEGVVNRCVLSSSNIIIRKWVLDDNKGRETDQLNTYRL